MIDNSSLFEQRSVPPSVRVSAFGSIRARGDAILRFLSFPLEGVFLDLDFFYSSAGLSNFDVTTFREGEDYYDRVLCVGEENVFLLFFLSIFEFYGTS
jgi:hypothetical protein